MTLEALQYLVTDLALKHNLVNCAMSGPSIYAINPEDIKEYPLIFVSPTGTHTIKENTTRYSLTFFYMDRLFEDSSNEETINSAGIETLRNLKLQLSKIEVVTDIQEDADIRLFTETERMADRVAGAYMTIWIETLNPSTCPAFFDEYGFYMGNYFATEGLENVLDGLASKEWVERLIAGLSISGITPEEFERIMGDYVLRKNFATINGSKITNKEVFTLVEQDEYSEQIQQILQAISANTQDITDITQNLTAVTENITVLSGDTTEIENNISNLSASTTQEIQNIYQAISAATPSDYDAVKEQVSANTENITNLSASTQEEIQNIYQTISGISPEGYESLQEQVSANTEDIAELKTAVSGINETIEIQNSAITGINETLVVLSAQTSANTAQIADLSGSTSSAVSSLTHDIETLSEAISGLTPEGYEALQQQVSANTEDIAELSGITTGISSDLQALSSYTANISELVSANTNSINTLNGQVTGLTSDLAALSAFTETLTGGSPSLFYVVDLNGNDVYNEVLSAYTEGKIILLSCIDYYDKEDVILQFASYTTGSTTSTTYFRFQGVLQQKSNSNSISTYNVIVKADGTFEGAIVMGGYRYAQRVTVTPFRPYSLPTASATVKGGVKVGTGLSMNGQVMNADVASNDVHTIVSLTQSAYDALATKDANTLYIIKPLY